MHAREEHRARADDADAERVGGACSRRLSRAKVSVTLVEDTRPPSSPATGKPRPGPTLRRAMNPAKLRPAKKSTSSHSSRGRIPPSGPYGPSRQQREDDDRHHREARRRAQLLVVDARDERVQLGLFDQEQRRDRDDAARQRQRADPGEHAGGDDDQRGHLGRAVDIAPARGDIRGDDQRDRPDDEGDGDARMSLVRQPARQPRDAAEHRERAHPAEVRLGARGVPGTLALDADGGATQGGDGETHDGGQVGHGSVERAGARTNPDLAGRKRRRSQQMTGVPEEG